MAPKNIKIGNISSKSKMNVKPEKIFQDNSSNIKFLDKSAFVSEDNINLYSPSQESYSDQPFETLTGIISDSPEILLINNLDVYSDDQGLSAIEPLLDAKQASLLIAARKNIQTLFNSPVYPLLKQKAERNRNDIKSFCENFIADIQQLVFTFESVKNNIVPKNIKPYPIDDKGSIDTELLSQKYSNYAVPYTNLQKLLLDDSEIPTTWSATKFWLQTCLEFKDIIKDGMAVSFIGNSTTPVDATVAYKSYYQLTKSKNSKIQKFYFKRNLNKPNIYLFLFDGQTATTDIFDQPQSSNDNTDFIFSERLKYSTLSTIKNVIKNNFTQNLDAANPTPEDIAKIAYALCNEYVYSTDLNFNVNDQLMLKYGYNPSNRRDNKDFWDYAIGVVGQDITDFASNDVGNGNSLTNLAQTTEVYENKTYKILTFEDRYLIDDVGTINSAKLLTPGSNFYIEGTLNNAASSFEIDRIDKLINRLDSGISLTNKISLMIPKSEPWANWFFELFESNNISFTGAPQSQRVKRMFNDPNFLGSNTSSVFKNPITLIRTIEKKIISDSPLGARNVVKVDGDINSNLISNRLHSPIANQFEKNSSKDISWLLISLAEKNEDLKALLFMRAVQMMNKIKRSSNNDFNYDQFLTSFFVSFKGSIKNILKLYQDETFNPYTNVVDQTQTAIAVGVSNLKESAREIAEKQLKKYKNTDLSYDLPLSDSDGAGVDQDKIIVELQDDEISYGPGFIQIKVRVYSRDFEKIEVSNYQQSFVENGFGLHVWKQLKPTTYNVEAYPKSNLNLPKVITKIEEQTIYSDLVEDNRVSRVYLLKYPASPDTPYPGEEFPLVVYKTVIREDIGKIATSNVDMSSEDMSNPSLLMLNKISEFMASIDTEWFIASNTNLQTPYAGVPKMVFYAELFKLCCNIVSLANPEEVIATKVTPLSCQFFTKIKNTDFININESRKIKKTVYQYDDFLAKSEYKLWNYSFSLNKIINTFSEALTFIKSQFQFLKSTLTSQRYVDLLNTVNSVLQNPEMTKQLMHKNQLFLVGSKMNDLITRSDATYSSPVKETVPYFLDIKDNPDIDLSLPFDDTDLVAWNLWLKNFFKNKIFNRSNSFNKKIMSIGIPQRLQRYLQTNVSDFYGSSKKNNLIVLKIYRIDYFRPDVIYSPLRYIFDLNNYPRRILDPYVNLQKIQSKEGRDFFNLDENDPQDYPSQNAPTGAFDQFKAQLGREGYEFLSNDPKQLSLLIQNHMISFLLEKYLYFRSGIKLDEHAYKQYTSISNYIDANIPLLQQVNNVQNISQLQQTPPGGGNKMNPSYKELFTNETYFGDYNAIIRSLIMPKKFDRVFHVIFDPDDFVIDVPATTAPVLSRYFLRNEIIRIEENSQFIYKNPPQKQTDVLLDKYFVELESYEKGIAS
jgi:hypothetical protein